MLEEYSDLITIEELCDIVQIGRNTAYHLLNSGFMPPFALAAAGSYPKVQLLVC